jgi:hypothetical protein
MYPGIYTLNDFFEYAIVNCSKVTLSALGIKELDSENLNISTMVTHRPAEVLSTSMLNAAERSSLECVLTKE